MINTKENVNHWQYVEKQTIGKHSFGHLMRIAICKWVSLRPDYFFQCIFNDCQCLITLLHALSVALTKVYKDFFGIKWCSNTKV